MSSIVHLIYSSASTKNYSDEELRTLLEKSRERNLEAGVTGMLLHENGSFFQVLEGPQEAVEELFDRILDDQRHDKIVIIIREPIAQRTFGDWTMGFPGIESEEIDKLIGLNDFFSGGATFSELRTGRAKKLLRAFRDGRWHSKKNRQLREVAPLHGNRVIPPLSATAPQTSRVSFAFQPVVNIHEEKVIAYEAIVRGSHDESFSKVALSISTKEWTRFDSNCRAMAINDAKTLGLTHDLHIRFLARHVDDARAAIQSTREAAERHGFTIDRLLLLIDQERLIGDTQNLARIVEGYRSAGLRISIDHFGAGRTALSLLEVFRPDMIALNSSLVRDVDTNGARQAIVRGVIQTCRDLGIDIVAKHVRNLEEYIWLRDEGVDLMQGSLIAPAAFEKLPVPYFPTFVLEEATQ